MENELKHQSRLQKESPAHSKYRKRRVSSQQLALGLKFRGGKRKGAGRKNRSGLQAHLKRKEFHRLTPVHVTLKVRKGIPNLRKKQLFVAFKRAVEGAWGKGLRIQHYCLLSNHLHLIVEASSHKELETIFRSFGTRFSKQVNKQRLAKGRVFNERYHAHVLQNPSETARAMRYVLTNEHKHLGLIPKKRNRKRFADTHAVASTTKLKITPFCSNWCFEDFETLMSKKTSELLDISTAYSNEAMNVCQLLLDPPQSWLLRKGWQQSRHQNHYA